MSVDEKRESVEECEGEESEGGFLDSPKWLENDGFLDSPKWLENDGFLDTPKRWENGFLDAPKWWDGCLDSPKLV